MKIYVFNSNEPWSVDICHAVFADSLDEAHEYFSPVGEYNVREVEIRSGLILKADGYDNSRMLVCS